MSETLLDVARVMARRGTCSRAQVGVVVAFDGRIVACGYNGAPRGLSHCEHPPDELSDELSTDAPTCDVSVHAEANAVAFAARCGIALDGATLYATHTPCVTCAQLLVNAGVVNVFAERRYRDPAGVELLRRARITVFVAAPPPTDDPGASVTWELA